MQVSNRAGQSASERSTSDAQQNNHRRKGRTGSASDNSSAGDSPNLTARDEGRSINLPPGQGVNTDDFGMAISLADRVARMSYVAETPGLQRPLNPSESSSSVLGQVG